MQTFMSVGSTFLGALVGGRKVTQGTIGKATTAARGFSRASQQSGDVARAKETVDAYEEELKKLQDDFDAEVEKLASPSSVQTEELETITVKPKTTGVTVKVLSLVWVPT